MRFLSRIGATAFGAGGGLALALMAGRLSGLGREIVLAERFGASRDADIVFVLLALPDLLVNLLLSGGLSAALVPRLKMLAAPEGARLAWEACAAAMMLTLALAAVIMIWPGGIFAVFAPGIVAEGDRIAGTTAALVAASIPLAALSGIAAAYLAAEERFFVSGLGTLIFNLALISALLLNRGDGLVVLAVAICTGAAMRLAAQIAVLPRPFWRPAAQLVIDWRFVTTFLAGIAASALTLAPSALVRAASSLIGTGSVAMFNYAQKLVELPLGILITTIGTVALSRLSGYFGAGDAQGAHRDLVSRLRLALMLASLVAALGIVLARPVVSILFFRGAMTLDQVEQIAQLTRVALLGVPFAAVSSLATASLNAQGGAALVLKASGAALIGLMVLMVPGLVLSSGLALMAAVVGSQALLCFILARYAGICLWGPAGFADRSWFGSIGIALLVSLCIVLPAYVWLEGRDVLAIVAGAAGFLAGAATYLHLARER
jgi:putative peptidoglycan lipid II flippase